MLIRLFTLKPVLDVRGGTYSTAEVCKLFVIIRFFGGFVPIRIFSGLGPFSWGLKNHLVLPRRLTFYFLKWLLVKEARRTNMFPLTFYFGHKISVKPFSNEHCWGKIAVTMIESAVLHKIEQRVNLGHRVLHNPTGSVYHKHARAQLCCSGGTMACGSDEHLAEAFICCFPNWNRLRDCWPNTTTID